VGLVLRGGLLWSGTEEPGEAPGHRDVTIEDGVVTGVWRRGTAPATSDDVEVALDGAFVMPGLIDMHVHLVWSGGADPARTVEHDGEQLTTIRAVANARSQLHAGITTVRDLGSNWDIAVSIAKAIDRGVCEGPTVVASGRTVIMTGGHDGFWGIPSDGVDAVTRAVRTQVHVGAGVIKTAATGGAYGRAEGEAIGQSELSYEELCAIAAEARRFGLHSAAHALGTDGIRNAVRAGIDTIEHGVFLTDDIVAEMLRKGTALCPTLATYRRLAAGNGIPAYAAEKARTVITAHTESVKMAIDAGVPVVAGTDAGAPFLPHPALVDELLVLEECGMSRQQALRSATSGAADVLGRPEWGRLAAGSPADLLILEGDPHEDLENLRRVWGVLRAGNQVTPLGSRIRYRTADRESREAIRL